MRAFGWGGETNGSDYYSPGDFTATMKGPNRAHLTGIAPTITNAGQFRHVRAYNADGSLAAEYWPSAQTPFMWNPLTNYLTVVGADWGSAGYLVVHINAQHRGYDPSSDSWQHYIVNPEHAWTQQATLADVTNGTDNNPGGVYYYVDFDQYRYGALQLALDCAAGTVTATVEATAQDDGTAQVSCAYEDVTNDLFGVASLVAAAGAASDMWVIDTPFPVKYIRVKIVAATGGNTGDWTLYWRGVY